MYVVTAPNGFSFSCVELEDAVSLADSLAKELEEYIVVVDEDSAEIAYITQ